MSEGKEVSVGRAVGSVADGEKVTAGDDEADTEGVLRDEGVVVEEREGDREGERDTVIVRDVDEVRDVDISPDDVRDVVPVRDGETETEGVRVREEAVEMEMEGV